MLIKIRKPQGYAKVTVLFYTHLFLSLWLRARASHSCFHGAAAVHCTLLYLVLLLLPPLRQGAAPLPVGHHEVAVLRGAPRHPLLLAHILE